MKNIILAIIAILTIANANEFLCNHNLEEMKKASNKATLYNKSEEFKLSLFYMKEVRKHAIEAKIECKGLHKGKQVDEFTIFIDTVIDETTKTIEDLEKLILIQSQY